MKKIALTITAAALLLCTGAAAQDRLNDELFSLSEVELLDGPFKHACELNVQVLLKYDMDRLLAPFLKEAGLEPKGEYFPNWEGLDGHVGGHYVSALAIHYAATGSRECYDRLLYMLSEMQKCQEANGNGYIGGVPNGDHIWTEVSKGNFAPLHGAWVPWYNVHKTFAGLRDAWQYAGVEQAKDMFIKLCDWAVNLTSALSDAQMDDMVSQEFGGMDEVLADAYFITGDRKYITAAKRFAHHLILDSMAQGVDNLDNRHANTQVPKVVGYARIADVDNDGYFEKAAEFFWDRVVNYRSVVIGGNSRSEHFPSDSDYESFIEQREGPESCNTNNMLKLTELLFRMRHDARYADYYERAMYNHILSTQHPVHGGYVYFTPMRPSHYRVYSQPNSGMWCCVGTGMENHGKYGEFIYSHEGDKELYVNLFVASRLNWDEAGACITQQTDFPYSDTGRIIVNLKKSKRFKIFVRCPEWATEGYSVKVNGVEYAADAKPSSFVCLDRKWKDNDVIELTMPMKNKLVELPNEPQYLAVLHGPIVLAARTSQEHLDGLIADDGRWSHIASGPLVPLAQTPIFVGSRAEIEARIQNLQPVPGKPLHYSAEGLFNKPEFDSLELEPFFSLHDSRYAIYFLSLTSDGYSQMLKKIADDEKEALERDRRTVDRVTPGEQQPEVDHRMKAENSIQGYQDNNPFRTIRKDGFFSYELGTSGIADLRLSLAFWGNENAEGRGFEILVDGKTLAVENELPQTRENALVYRLYSIPEDLVRGKEYITVTFKGIEGRMAARIFDVRLLKELVEYTEKVVYEGPDVIIRQIDDHTWEGNGHLVYNESIYIVEGSQRALLIDVGTAIRDLDKIVAGITSKPVTLVATHVHGDHTGSAVKYFPEIWINAADMVNVPSNMRGYKGKINYLSDGQVFDLGDREIEVVFTPGHTPGSTTFFDKEKGYGFSGDAFGSTNLLLTTNFSTLLNTCTRVERYMEKYGIGYMYPGHYHGSNAETLQRVKDMKMMSEEMLDGTRHGGVNPKPSMNLDCVVEDFGVKINYSSVNGLK